MRSRHRSAIKGPTSLRAARMRVRRWLRLFVRSTLGAAVEVLAVGEGVVVEGVGVVEGVVVLETRSPAVSIGPLGVGGGVVVRAVVEGVGVPEGVVVFEAGSPAVRVGGLGASFV